MSSPKYALAKMDDLEKFIDKTDLYEGNNQLVFELLINSISAFMERETDRKLAARDYSYAVSTDKDDAIGDGDGTTQFFTKQHPINSITELKIGDDVIAAASDWDEDGYFFYPAEGKIYYESGFDAGYPQNIKLKYNAGYAATTAEYDTLNLICCALIKYIWDNKSRLGLKSEFLGRYRYTRGMLKETDEWIFETLNTFRRRSFF